MFLKVEDDIIKFKNPYWSDRLKVSWLQRRVIVHSIIYYFLNSSVIDDFTYDALSRQLVRMQSKLRKEDFKKTDYYYCMHDFDGTTGFDLYDRLNQEDQSRLYTIAMLVLRSYQETHKE